MKAYINSRECEFEQGESILAVARRNGFFIPSLCHFSPLNHTPGTCRVCLVQVTDEAGTRLVTSCDTPLSEGMQVNTYSSKVRERQRMQVEMILADHHQDCASCTRHGDCELQDLAEAVGLTRNRFANILQKPAAGRVVDESATAMFRDMTKCIRCLRCVTVCRDVQGVAALTVDGKGLGSHIGVGMAPNHKSSACIQCGQCILVCPTGSLGERDQNDTVLDYLASPDVTTVFSFAPSVRVLMGDEFGFAPGTNVEGKIVAALRAIGADIVIDTDFAADVTIMEEGYELLGRIKNGGTLPMFTSCCPAWINFAEKHIPDILPHISSTRSPQGIQGALVKSYLAEKMHLDPKRIKNISIMPCIAKKDEAARPQLARDGVPDNDVVISVREFSRLLRRLGVDFVSIPPEPFDNPFMSASTGAAVIFGTTGGVMEAAVRTVHAVLAGKELQGIVAKPLRGLEGVRTAELTLGPAGPVKLAICHGLRNARILAEEVLAGKSPYTFIEVMACPGGCIDGGGSSRIKGAYHPARARKQQSLYDLDHQMTYRQSHNNPQIKLLYSSYLGEPNSEKAHHLLHTHYSDRQDILTESIDENKRRLTLTD